MAAKKTWHSSMPNCFFPDADTLEEALSQASLELDLIDEGQEAAECYTAAEVKSLRKWVNDNRSKQTNRRAK